MKDYVTLHTHCGRALGHYTLGGVPRKDGPKTLTHLTMRRKAQANGLARTDRSTPRSHPSGVTLPVGLAGQYSSTVHFLTKPCLPGHIWEPFCRAGSIHVGRGTTTLSLSGEVNAIPFSCSSTSQAQLLIPNTIILTHLVQAPPL